MTETVDLYPSQQQTREILKEIMGERLQQENKWGQQNHPAHWYYLILAEEVGEVAKAILENKVQTEYRAELVQVAAVAVAMIESLDRSKKRV